MHFIAISIFNQSIIYEGPGSRRKHQAIRLEKEIKGEDRSRHCLRGRNLEKRVRRDGKKEERTALQASEKGQKFPHREIQRTAWGRNFKEIFPNAGKKTLRFAIYSRSSFSIVANTCKKRTPSPRLFLLLLLLLLISFSFRKENF